MKLFIRLNEEIDEIDFCDNVVVINTNNLYMVEELLNNKMIIDEQLKAAKEEFDSFSENDNDFFGSELYDFKKNILDLLKKASEKSLTLQDFFEIEIYCDNISIIERQKAFFESTDVEFVLDVKDISFEDALKLKNINFKKEPLIRSKYNGYDDFSLSDYIETIETINIMKEHISKYALSPLEQLMLLYDLVKERRYIKSGESDYSPSRDLSRIVKEDAIVCEGYANMFAIIANELGIVTEVKYYDPIEGNVGHADNMVFLNDAFYGIQCCFEVDASTGRNRNGDIDINFYDGFGIPSIAYEKYLSARLIPVIASGSYDKIMDNMKKIDDCLKQGDSEDEMLVTIHKKNTLSHIINIYKKLGDYEKAKEISSIDAIISLENLKLLVDEIAALFSKRIPYKVFYEAFYNVRRVEHADNPLKYPLDANTLESVTSKRKNKSDRLLDAIFQFELPRLPQKISNINQGSNNEKKINYDIERMRLIHGLRAMLKEKENESRNKH